MCYNLELEGITLIEISQAQKDNTTYDITYMWNLKTLVL
jgi:hypothetical protein